MARTGRLTGSRGLLWLLLPNPAQLGFRRLVGKQGGAIPATHHATHFRLTRTCSSTTGSLSLISAGNRVDPTPATRVIDLRAPSEIVFCQCLDTPGLNGRHQRRVVTLILVGIRFSKNAYGHIELIRFT